MGFSDDVQVAALTACQRCCCICHKFCGTKIELHHIKQKADGGEDTFENCIPLCFDCHADMGKADPRHPKGKHYSERELKKQRDNWYEEVKNKREGFSPITDEDIDRLCDDIIVLDCGNASGHSTKNKSSDNSEHSVIIDNEPYIPGRVLEEREQEILDLLREI